MSEYVILLLFVLNLKNGRKEFFNLMTHLTHFNYGHKVLDIWYRTTQIENKPTATTLTTLSD